MVSSSSSSSPGNVNYNASATTSNTAVVANNNNNNNNIRSFITSITVGENNNMSHNNPNHTASLSQQNFVNGEVGGAMSIPPTTATSSLTVNDLNNLSNLQAAATWNQQNTSQLQQNLTTLHVIGQSGTGGMSSSHV